MKIINTTNGYNVQVSDEDFLELSLFSWQAALREGKVVGVGRKPGKRTIPLSEVILKLHGIFFNGLIDHKDRDPLNNQIENLRPATKSQNMANRGRFSNNSTGYKGVSFLKRDSLYVARIQFRGQSIFIGRFQDPTIAAKAYDRVAKRCHGAFAVLNFPET